MSVLEMSIRLYITTDSSITTTYGIPWPKYSEGIQRQGWPSSGVLSGVCHRHGALSCKTWV